MKTAPERDDYRKNEKKVKDELKYMTREHEERIY